MELTPWSFIFYNSYSPQCLTRKIRESLSLAEAQDVLSLKLCHHRFEPIGGFKVPSKGEAHTSQRT